MCERTAFRYGRIKGKYVIYRGEEVEVDGVKYLNVEEYLKNYKQMCYTPNKYASRKRRILLS